MPRVEQRREIATREGLEVRFERDGLFPEGVPLTSLSRALQAIHRLATGGVRRDEEEEEPAGEAEDLGPFQLVSVRRGSAVYRFAGQHPEAGWDRLRAAGLAVAGGDAGEGPSLEDMIYPIRELSRIARRLECEIEIRRPSRRRMTLARIGPGSFDTLASTLFVEGETEIAGQIKGVGGVESMRCRIRVPNRKDLLYCDVKGGDVARQLGGLLYQDVVVRGWASWLKRSWKLHGFTIHGVYRPRDMSFEEAMRGLRAAGGSGWDDVEDPEAFLREIRGER